MRARPIGRLIALVVAVLALAACGGTGMDGATVVSAGEHRVGAGGTLVGTVVVADGRLIVDAGATVRGDLLVIGGALRLAGEVTGDLSALVGSVAIADTAHVRGALRMGGSAEVDRAEGARIDGGVETDVSAGGGAEEGDPLVDAGWLVARTLVAVLVALAIRQIAPRRVRAIRRCLTDLPAASGAYGFLVGVVGLSLAFFMAFTLVLIPVAIVLLGALALGVVAGLAGAFDALAARFGSGRGLALTLAGLVLASVVPVVGPIAVALGATAALGAAALSFHRPVPADGPRGPAGDASVPAVDLVSR